MNGKVCKSIYLSATEFTDPAREDDYTRWYSYEHLPHFCASGVFHQSSLYKAVTPGAPTHLAIYDTYLDDPAETRAIHDIERKHRVAIGLLPFGAYTRGHYDAVMAIRNPGLFSSFRAPAKTGLTGLVLLGANPKKGSTRDTMNGWYDNGHMEQLARSGAFTACYSFEAFEPSAKAPRFMNLYETDLDNVQNAVDIITKLQGSRGAKAHHLQNYEIVRKEAYRLLVSYEREPLVWLPPLSAPAPARSAR